MYAMSDRFDRSLSMDDLADELQARSGTPSVAVATPVATAVASPVTPLAVAAAPVRKATPSAQQLDILRWVDQGRGHAEVIARAGTGKTWVILKAIEIAHGEIAIAVFNNGISSEISKKLGMAGLRANVDTFHAYGSRALKPWLHKKAEMIGDRKASLILDKLEVPSTLRGMVRKAISLGMQRGIGIQHSFADLTAWKAICAHYELDADIEDTNILVQLHGCEKVIEQAMGFAARGIKLGIKMAKPDNGEPGVYSFDDQLYLPLYYKLPMKEYDFVFIDEAQDSNYLRQLMAYRMTRKHPKTKQETGRRMWVLDPLQAINGFAGADNDAYEIIRQRDNCTVFKMDVTFRCAKAVVRLVNPLVPDYKADEGNLEGSVSTIDEAAFRKMTLVPGEDAIICRNTKPLIDAAYGLMKRGIPCKVLGRSIGKGLIGLMQRFPQATSLPDLIDRLGGYRESEVAKLIARGKDATADDLGDQVDSLITLAQGMKDGSLISDLVSHIRDLFAEVDEEGKIRDVVALMTAHKSKGLEFQRVFGWGVARFMPSQRAKQPWMIAQERNLEYVLKTRAIEHYIDVVVG